MNGIISQANILARIGALAGFYEIDLGPLEEALGSLGPRLSRGARVTVPVTFDRIAVATRVGRMALDDLALVHRDQLRRVDKLVADGGDVELELETGSDVASEVRAAGARDLLADCEKLASFGVGTLALDSLRDCAAHLGSPCAIADRQQAARPGWSLHFAHSNASAAARTRTRAQVLTVARKLGATAPQCNLVDGMHDVLTKDRDSESVLLVSPEQTTLQLAVRWQHVRWETAIRMALGFQPGSDAGKRLGELAGAFDADAVAALELVLGTREPPVMRITVGFPA